VAKNIKIIFIFIFSILLVSCGFKKIQQIGDSIIYIQKINIVGDKRIGYLLKNNILLISNKNGQNYEIEIEIEKNKKGKIKNSSGKFTRYTINVKTKVILKSINNLGNFNKLFTISGDYDVALSHSDTINNENITTKNIIDQLSDDILYFIKFSIKN